MTPDDLTEWVAFFQWRAETQKEMMEQSQKGKR